jgi:hypothetical protein
MTEWLLCRQLSLLTDHKYHLNPILRRVFDVATLIVVRDYFNFNTERCMIGKMTLFAISKHEISPKNYYSEVVITDTYAEFSV